MSKAPLLKVSGKVGLFMGRKQVPVTGTGSLSKSHGHLILKAEVTATQARRALELEEMRKKVPVEKEAATRALVPGARHHEKDVGHGRVVTNPSGADPIVLRTHDGSLTHAGHAYYAKLAGGYGDAEGVGTAAEARAGLVEQRRAAEMIHGKRKDLVDPFLPKAPEMKAGESQKAFDQRVRRWEKALDKRILERETPSHVPGLRSLVAEQTEAELIGDARLVLVGQLTGQGDFVDVHDWYTLLTAKKYKHEARNGKTIVFNKSMCEKLITAVRESVQRIENAPPPRLPKNADFTELYEDIRTGAYQSEGLDELGGYLVTPDGVIFTRAQVIVGRERAKASRAADAKRARNAITLRVKDQLGGIVQFDIKKTTPLRKLMTAYAKRAPPEYVLRFLQDGYRIKPEDTAESLGMDDQDIIDVDGWGGGVPQANERRGVLVGYTGPAHGTYYESHEGNMPPRNLTM